MLTRLPTGVQLSVVTPVMAKGPPGMGGPDAGLTVRVKVVLTERLPGSVAVMVTVETPDALGVPLMVVPARLNPAGKPVALNTRELGVSASVKVVARLRVKA